MNKTLLILGIILLSACSNTRLEGYQNYNIFTSYEMEN